jgi:hypothetical protein
MPYEIWDVVGVPAFPNQENKKEVTTRPAIIIEDLQNEVLICPVTKQVHQSSKYKYTILIAKDSIEAKEMGLTFESIIILDRHEQLSKFRLKHTNCSCPSNIVEQIEVMIEQMRKDGIKTI